MRAQRKLMSTANSSFHLIAHCRYVYTAEDVQRMVEGRRSKGKATNLAVHKARLQRQLEHAIENDNADLQSKCAACLPIAVTKAGLSATSPCCHDHGLPAAQLH